MSTQTDFIDKYSGAIVRASKGSGIFPSVKMAQAALESGWGKSAIGNNLFGIKATGAYSPYWKGDYIAAGTKEDYGNGQVSITDKFRKYKSIEDSIRDHTYFLIQNSRYANAGVFAAKTPAEQIAAIKAAGYATASDYVSAVMNIINQYHLTDLDGKISIKEKEYKPEAPLPGTGIIENMSKRNLVIIAASGILLITGVIVIIIMANKRKILQ